MSKKTKTILLAVIGLAVLAYFKTVNKETTDQKDNMDTNENTNDITPRVNSKATVGFYNVENLFDIYDDPRTSDNEFTPDGDLFWDRERYNDKLNKISSAIIEINYTNPPALLGFAEVENFDVLKDLIHTGDLADFPYKIIHKDNHDRRGIDVAAIYREDLFDVRKHRFYPVTLPGEKEPTTRDILHIEGAFANHETVHVFFTHWSSRRKGTAETEHKRISTAKILRQKIDLVLEKDSKAKIFILGDFNDEPSDKSISKYLTKSDFYNLSQKFEHTKNGTVNHQGDWLVFDQIIVSKNLLNEKLFNISKNDIHIHNSDKVTFTHRDGNTTPSRTYGGPKYYGGYSDHYAVYLNLKIKS